jgi:hypothetical protein
MKVLDMDEELAAVPDAMRTEMEQALKHCDREVVIRCRDNVDEVVAEYLVTELRDADSVQDKLSIFVGILWGLRRVSEHVAAAREGLAAELAGMATDGGGN